MAFSLFLRTKLFGFFAPPAVQIERVGFLCAATGLTFTGYYGKPQWGGWHRLAVHRDSDKAAAAPLQELPPGRDIPLSDFARNAFWFPCPYCSKMVGPIRCNRCHRLVCDGRTTRAANYFRCCIACGDESPISPTLEVIEVCDDPVSLAHRGGGADTPHVSPQRHTSNAAVLRLPRR